MRPGLVVALALLSSVAGAAETKWTDKVAAGKELYATLKTSAGDIVVKLYSKDSPKTVANFVGLATGEKEWTDPNTHQKTTRPLYNGTIFHRVIPKFMIQGGDPLGTGEGTPGYEFEDEVKNGKNFDQPGMLAMANAGPNTNGSQFFITDAATPRLNGHYSIFGELVSGLDVVEKIINAPREMRLNRPNDPTTIQKIVLSETSPKADKPTKKAVKAKAHPAAAPE